MINIKDIAKKLNISAATVSRANNNKEGVKSAFSKGEGFKLMKKTLALPSPLTSVMGINENVKISQ